MFDWNDARYFLAVRRLGSLSQAARQLRVQQSTVGRRLAALEDALGARLFERTPSGYSATPAGEAFAAHAARIEDEALAAARRMAGREAAVAGTVRMTAPQAFGFYLVTSLLARLHALQPAILVELVAENVELSLSRREADVALRLGRATRQQQLVGRRLGDVVEGFFVARSYLDEHGPVRHENLARHTFIDFDQTYPRSRTPEWVRQRLRRARCVLKLNGTPGILTAVRAGMGIGLLPCWLASQHADLVRVLPDTAQSAELWLLVHPDLRHTARIRVVTEFFARELVRLAPLLAGRV
jgi:DNA-binding transcriptional LysR family regulator